MLIMWRLPQLHGDPLPIVLQMIHQMIHRIIDSSKLAPLHWKRETSALLNERLPDRWIGRESERDDGDVSFIVRNDDATAIVTTTTVANTAFDDGDVSFIVRYDDATATATRTTTTVANTAFVDGDVSFIVRYDDMTATASTTKTTVANTAFNYGEVRFIVRYDDATDIITMCNGGNVNSYNNHCRHYCSFVILCKLFCEDPMRL